MCPKSANWRLIRRLVEVREVFFWNFVGYMKYIHMVYWVSSGNGYYVDLGKSFTENELEKIMNLSELPFGQVLK
jgi:hypothetical protein